MYIPDSNLASTVMQYQSVWYLWHAQNVIDIEMTEGQK